MSLKTRIGALERRLKAQRQAERQQGPKYSPHNETGPAVIWRGQQIAAAMLDTFRREDPARAVKYERLVAYMANPDSLYRQGLSKWLLLQTDLLRKEMGQEYDPEADAEPRSLAFGLSGVFGWEARQAAAAKVEFVDDKMTEPAASLYAEASWWSDRHGKLSYFNPDEAERQKATDEVLGRIEAIYRDIIGERPDDAKPADHPSCSVVPHSGDRASCLPSSGPDKILPIQNLNRGV